MCVCRGADCEEDDEEEGLEVEEGGLGDMLEECFHVLVCDGRGWGRYIPLSLCGGGSSVCGCVREDSDGNVCICVYSRELLGDAVCCCLSKASEMTANVSVHLDSRLSSSVPPMFPRFRGASAHTAAQRSVAQRERAPTSPPGEAACEDRHCSTQHLALSININHL